MLSAQSAREEARLSRNEGPQDVGVVHGRFQVFHNDHLKYALAAKRQCGHLIVGLTSPDPQSTHAEELAPHRSDLAANPMTYFERLQVVSQCLVDASVPCGEFSVVPFPIEQPNRLVNYAPRDATYFLTVNDSWGEEKARRLRGLNLRVCVLWTDYEKRVSGSLIRDLIVKGGPWRDLVPPATASFVDRIKLADRMAGGASKGRAY